MSSSYRHTQISFLFAAILVFFLFVAILMVVSTQYAWEAVILYVLLAAVFTNFLTLTIEVSASKIGLRYGFGFIRRTIPLSEIENLCVAEITRPRKLAADIATSTTLYDLAGSQVVEIDLRNGSAVLLGTDEPVELARAIENELIAMRKK